MKCDVLRVYFAEFLFIRPTCRDVLWCGATVNPSAVCLSMGLSKNLVEKIQTEPDQQEKSNLSQVRQSCSHTFLSPNLYDIPGLAPRMNVLFWVPGDFPVSYSNRDTSWNAWNCHSGSFMVNTEILFSTMKSSSHECLMTFWPSTNSDLPSDQSLHQFHDLYTELHLQRIMSGFHGGFASGVAYQQGTLTLTETWFRPPFWDLLMLQFLRPDSSNLQCLYPWYFLDFAWYIYSLFLFRIRGQWSKSHARLFCKTSKTW